MRLNILRSTADSAAGGPPPEDVATLTGNQPPPAAPTPPPAAAIVQNGDVTEDNLKLRQELDAEKSARKKAEADAAHAQDEAHRLKQATAAPKKKTVTRRTGLFTRTHED